MPGRTLQTDAFVLLRRPPTDVFQSFSVFSAVHGALLILQRMPKKASPDPASSRRAAPHLALDLFDEVALLLESSNQGRTWFVKEPRLITRHAAIGRSYDSLRFASALAGLIARNPVHEDSRLVVAALLRAAFAAFATAPRPDIVFFKSLYCFARDEGYPVKQQWFPALPPPDRAFVTPLLNQPLATQTAPPGEVARLQRRLEDYLRGHTDILLE
ncbi:MAG: hypothetical protein EXS39_04245 [Opitutaceae bacterium]|nr:hypothetical protein [Opitutaceae bacterium]